MRYGDSLSSLSLASSLSGGISLFSRAQVKVTSGSTSSSRAARPIYVYTEHAQFVDVIGTANMNTCTFLEGTLDVV